MCSVLFKDTAYTTNARLCRSVCVLLEICFILGAKVPLSAGPHAAENSVIPDAAAVLRWRWRRTWRRLSRVSGPGCRHPAAAASFTVHQASIDSFIAA